MHGVDIVIFLFAIFIKISFKLNKEFCCESCGVVAIHRMNALPEHILIFPAWQVHHYIGAYLCLLSMSFVSNDTSFAKVEFVFADKAGRRGGR